MVKTLFHIASETEQPDWSQCRLMMEAGHHFFSYTVLDAENHVAKLCYYEVETENGMELAAALEEIINSDAVLRKEMKEVVLVYNFPEAHIVPENHFDSSVNKQLIELLHGDLHAGQIISEKIQGWNHYTVFRVPPGVYSLFQRRIKNFSIRHYYSLWMECLKKQVLFSVEYISVIFYPNRILVAVIKNHQIHLLQEFSYQVAEDVSYHLLNACNLFDLAPGTVPLKMAGMVDESSAMYAEIIKYFGKASLDAYPAATAIPALEEYPPHFFSPLLKLAVCV